MVTFLRVDAEEPRGEWEECRMLLFERDGYGTALCVPFARRLHGTVAFGHVGRILNEKGNVLVRARDILFDVLRSCLGANKVRRVKRVKFAHGRPNCDAS